MGGWLIRSHTRIDLSVCWMGEFLCSGNFEADGAWVWAKSGQRWVVGQKKMSCAAKKCLVQQLGRGICPESILECCCGIKLTVKFMIYNVRKPGGSDGEFLPRESWIDTTIGQNIFSLMDCSSYNPALWGDHSTISFSWVTACGWSEAILLNAAFVTM